MSRHLIKNKRGEISGKASAIVFIGTFLAVFGFMVNSMPSLLGTGSQYQPTYPEELFKGIDVTNFYAYYNFSTVGVSEGYEEWGKEEFGHDLSTAWFDYSPSYIDHNHLDGFFLFPHNMECRSSGGTYRGYELDLDEIVLDHDSNNMSSYEVYCEHLTMMLWVSYNTTTYSSIYDAWDSDEVALLYAIDFDQAGTTWSGWSLIAQFLTFQAPEVHPAINFFIAIPIWICIGVLIVLVISLILPFVG